MLHTAAHSDSAWQCAVGEDMQQRQYFCSDKGFQAQDIAKAGAPCLSQAAKEEGLAVQVKVIQAGAAVWLPAQQGCDWPVNVMLEVRAPLPPVLPVAPTQPQVNIRCACGQARRPEV